MNIFNGYFMEKIISNNVALPSLKYINYLSNIFYIYYIFYYTLIKNEIFKS